MNLKTIPIALAMGASIAALALTSSDGLAQQVTGVLGSPSATITIDGNQLPPPPLPFGGVIKETASESTPFWPPRVVPPKGAPNVLLIMTDDQGYGVSGTFGGVIPTPALDRVAAAGLRYTEFHSTALCSPTRAALITGRNHHEVGYGVIGELSTGYPGYDSIIGPDNATIGRILRDNGYATSWFGKDHNIPPYQYSAAGPFNQWPVGLGFQYFYGFLGGETDQWTPYLYRNTSPVYPWVGKPGYNLTTDLADDAIHHMRELNASAPDKPFFLYYVPGGSHSPHQPTQEWIDKFHGKFDMGWEKLREQIFANQKRLGVIPPETQLTPWPDGQDAYGGAKLPRWDSLSLIQKTLYAREAEVFAAYTAYTDHEIGRVIQEVQDEGKLDNTLIIYIVGDNGTSAEGTLEGTFNQLTAYNGILTLPEVVQMLHYEDWGSHNTYPHMSVAWSWAFDTPFKWTKQVASHFGGTRQGLAISWPGHINDVGGIRTPVSPHHRRRPDDPRGRGNQGADDRRRHCAKADRRGEHGLHLRQGERQRAIEARHPVFRDGRQSRHLPRRLDRGDHAARRAVAARHRQAARPRDGVQVGALRHRERLFRVRRPRGENAGQAQGDAGAVQDRSGRRTTSFRSTIHGFSRLLTPRPSATAGKTEFTYVGENTGIPVGNAPSILDRDYTITADITVPEGGAEGMIVTLGGRFGGYGLYLLHGKPVFDYNFLDLKQTRWEGGVTGEDLFTRPLAPGKHRIVFDFKYDGPGLAKGGTGVLSVDGHELSKKTIEHTIPLLMSIDETFDVGADTRTPVDDSYDVPFRFTGTIDKLTFNLGPSQIKESDKPAIDEGMKKSDN